MFRRIKKNKSSNTYEMKTIRKLFPLFLFIFLLPHCSDAANQSGITKEIIKRYAISPNAKVTLINSFGTIHCTTWDKNEISINIVITAETESQEKASKFFNRVDFSITGSESAVTARTRLTKGNRFNGEFSINYTVHLPSTVNLDIINEFGDVIIGEQRGRSKINVEYGHVVIEKLTHGDNVLEIAFGSLRVGSMKGAVINSKFSKLNLGYAGSLRLTSHYSDLNLEDVVVMEGSLEGGEISLNEVAVLTLTTKYANIGLETLKEKLVVDGEFGNFTIKNVSSGFQSITIINEYGNYIIPIGASSSYIIDAESHYGGIQFPKAKTEFSTYISSESELIIQGTIGENPTGMVKIRSKFGNISLN